MTLQGMSSQVILGGVTFRRLQASLKTVPMKGSDLHGKSPFARHFTVPYNLCRKRADEVEVPFYLTGYTECHLPVFFSLLMPCVRSTGSSSHGLSQGQFALPEGGKAS